MAHTPDAPAGSLTGPADALDPDPSGGQGRGGLLSRLREVFAPPEPAAPVAVPALHATLPMPGILNLRKLRVDDVAVPKTDIVAVPVTISLDDLVTAFRDTGLTRIPVYDGDLDHALGLVNLKDFALRHGFRAETTEFDLRALLRPLLFVPTSMQASVLLQKMQAERTHMALVIDEYGGTDGLVSIEDIVEQVVGEIDDEHDSDEPPAIVRQADNSFVADARASLDDVRKVIGDEFVTGEAGEDVETLGGYLVSHVGRLPVRGELIAGPGNFEIEVLDADPRRVKRLRIAPRKERPVPRKERERSRREAVSDPGQPQSGEPGSEATTRPGDGAASQ